MITRWLIKKLTGVDMADGINPESILNKNDLKALKGYTPNKPTKKPKPPQGSTDNVNYLKVRFYHNIPELDERGVSYYRTIARKDLKYLR